VLGRGRPRPFDPAADGPALGEGAAVLVLEPASRARARGARAFARLVATPSFTVPAPVHGWPRDAAAIAAGLAAVVADADVVVAAASGRPDLDALEADVLARGPRAAVTTARGAIGDFGAAGALGVAVAALALADGVVPPTVGLDAPPRAGLDVVVGTARAARPRVVVVDGLARGGVCRPLRLEAAA
jgi:3-oxoacyl-(acyl-carrier-protein) synthase